MPKKTEKILITSALPYANGPIHLGHLAGAYLPADIYARYQRLQKREILFICGSDEHGVPITITAEKEGVTPQQIVDRFHEMNKKSFSDFGMTFDNYSRTSLPLHHETAKEFFLDLYEKKFLVEKKDKQLFCNKDNLFLADRYVEGTCPKCNFNSARGDQCEACGSWMNAVELINPKCKLCGSTPIVKPTNHFYLTFGKFQKKLEDYVHSHPEWKDNVKNYCEGWFREKLQDRAVTRDLRWGVPVPLPNFDGKVLYVWFDAVLGYISATKEWAIKKGNPDLWKNYWQDDSTKYIAFIGKDNIVFHTIVFPAMLMGKGKYILPNNVPANEFLNLEGGKFSKSRNNAIYLHEFLKNYSPDLLRYTIATNLPETKDSDFYWKDFQAKTNNELADILGNFINRTLTFVEKNFENKIPPRGILNERDTEILNRAQISPVKIANHFEGYHFRDGVFEAMELARASNKYFNDSQPWKTLKSNPEECATTLSIAIQLVKTLALIFSPVIPFTSEKIWKILNIQTPLKNENWLDASKDILQTGSKLNQSEILFTKIEDTQMENELNKLVEKSNELKVNAETLPLKPQITFENFQKIDLRVAKVISCEAVPKSKKLLKLQISIGNETRQIIAGIAKDKSPEEMVGKQIIVVANLAPAQLMGLESQGMLLATHGPNGEFSLLMPSTEVPIGSIVK